MLIIFISLFFFLVWVYFSFQNFSSYSGYLSLWSFFYRRNILWIN